MHFLIENYWWLCSTALLILNIIPDFDLSFKKHADDDIERCFSARRHVSALIIFFISNIINVKFAIPAPHYATGFCIIIVCAMYILDNIPSRIVGMLIAATIVIMPNVIIPHIIKNF